MNKYKVSIPEWHVTVSATKKSEALEIADELYDEHRDVDPYFGAFKVEWKSCYKALLAIDSVHPHGCIVFSC